MSTFKKLHLPWNFGKRYNVLSGKENSYYNTPDPKMKEKIEGPARLRRNTSLTRSVRDVVGTLRQKIRGSTRRRIKLKDDVPTPTPSKITKRKRSKPLHSIPATQKNVNVYKDIKLYSPFQIETPTKTPPGIRTSTRTRIAVLTNQVETPTCLRREVESLTSNMQALTTLTPNTLHLRQSRKSPLTNGSFQRRTGIRTSLRLQQKNEMSMF